MCPLTPNQYSEVNPKLIVHRFVFSLFCFEGLPRWAWCPSIVASCNLWKCKINYRPGGRLLASNSKVDAIGTRGKRGAHDYRAADRSTHASNTQQVAVCIARLLLAPHSVNDWGTWMHFLPTFQRKSSENAAKGFHPNHRDTGNGGQSTPPLSTAVKVWGCAEHVGAFSRRHRSRNVSALRYQCPGYAVRSPWNTGSIGRKCGVWSHWLCRHLSTSNDGDEWTTKEHDLTN